jgi:hypothetical protein
MNISALYARALTFILNHRTSSTAMSQEIPATINCWPNKTILSPAYRYLSRLPNPLPLHGC